MLFRDPSFNLVKLLPFYFAGTFVFSPNFPQSKWINLIQRTFIYSRTYGCCKAQAFQTP